MISCSSDSESSEPGEISFYHWQTNFNSNYENLKLTDSKKLYLRFFDLYYNKNNQKVFPKATIQISKSDTLPLKEIIPVIYITNEVFERIISPKQIKDLVDNTLKKIQRIQKASLNDSLKIKEIQLDCDWTEKTESSYFLFLRYLKQNKRFIDITGFKGKLSATIRLHQVKYFEKTGIPPVDKGVLMFYNMGDLGNIDEKNSIINIKKTKPYLTRLNDYPLELDMALPYYNWSVLYQNNQFSGILNNLSDEDIKKYFEAIDKNKYKAKTDAYLNRQFIYKDDILRIEKTTLEDLKSLKILINKNYAKHYNIILYRLNSNNLNKKSLHEIITLFSN